MPLLRWLFLLLLLLLLFPISACSRGIEVGSSSPAETYSISVDNQTGVEMVVSYNDGHGDAMLGSVRPGGTERFIIAAPASRTVTVRGRSASGSRTAGPYSIALVAGVTKTVTLR